MSILSNFICFKKKIASRNDFKHPFNSIYKEIYIFLLLLSLTKIQSTNRSLVPLPRITIAKKLIFQCVSLALCFGINIDLLNCFHIQFVLIDRFSPVVVLAAFVYCCLIWFCVFNEKKISCSNYNIIKHIRINFTIQYTNSNLIKVNRLSIKILLRMLHTHTHGTHYYWYIIFKFQLKQNKEEEKKQLFLFLIFATILRTVGHTMLSTHSMWEINHFCCCLSLCVRAPVVPIHMTFVLSIDLSFLKKKKQ